MRLAWAKDILKDPTGRPRLMTSGILLVALLVRLWKITDQSLWFDEAMTVFWASQPVARILHVGLTLSQDPHPPLYYLLVKGLVGLRPHEFWLRLPSVLWGIAVVWAGMKVSRLLVSTWASFFVGSFLALNPTLVWYSQEARMYAQATALLLLAWWLWLSWLQEPRPKTAAGYVLATLGAVYSYLLSLIWMPAQALAWLLTWRRDRRTLAGMGLLATTTLLSLPLAWRAWTHSGKTVLPHPVGNLPTTLWHLWTAWLLGKWQGPTWAVWATGGLAGGLLLLALLWPGRPWHKWGWVIAGVVPLPVGVALAARDPIVLAEVRYLLITLPGVAIAWAYALNRLEARWRGVGVLLAAVLLLTQGVALPASWAPEHRREDWRYAARYLQTHMGPKDAIIIHPDYVRVALEVYLDPTLPRYAPFHDYVRAQDVAPPLEELARRYDTLWLVESHTQTFDPNHLVRRWLDAHFPLVTEQYPNGITLRGYATRYRFDALPSHIPPLNATFRNGLVLDGCRIWDREVRARDDRAHPPSGWVHVSLYWRAETPQKEDVLSIARLVNAQGVWGERLYREREVLRMYPPSRWQVGEWVRDEQDINLNPVTPPGRYRVLVGLRTPDGQQVPAADGNPWVTCGEVTVRR